MTRKDMEVVMDKLFKDCQGLREAGQKEYAHLESNAFENFESVGKLLDMSREKVLMVFMLKHIFGIAAHVKGHKSQRESVRGRIKDAIVYLCLFAGMEEEAVAESKFAMMSEKTREDWALDLEDAFYHKNYKAMAELLDEIMIDPGTPSINAPTDDWHEMANEESEDSVPPKRPPGPVDPPHNRSWQVA